MKRMLAAHRVTAIQFEYGGCNIDSRALLRDLFALFHSFGYRVGKLHPDGVRFAPSYDQRFENFQYQNWVAVAPNAPFVYAALSLR
jgi:hypothetical protein